MRRVVYSCALIATAVLGVAGFSAAASGSVRAPAHAVTVRFVGIDRHGNQAPVFATVTTMSGFEVVTGTSGKLAPGRYIVGADVETDVGLPTLTQSLVVRQVRVTRSETITLDARTARAVHVSLAVGGATDQQDAAAVTWRSTDAQLAGANGAAGSLYVAPLAQRSLCFGFISRWQAGAARFYDLSAVVGHGVPNAPAFSFRPQQLARVAMSVRTGITQPPPATYSVSGLQLQPGDPSQFTCAAGLIVDPTSMPLAETDFMSAGTWTEATVEPDNGDMLVTRLRAGHAYTVSLGDAVAAPSGEFPFALGGGLQFTNEEIFSYPLGTSSSAECCAKSIGTLKLGSHLVLRKKFTAPQGSFEATLLRSGWYTFNVDSTRVGFQGQPMRGVLSPRIVVNWRFYATPQSSQAFPLTLATYLPAGLSGTNSAAPHAMTTLRMQISRPSDSPGTPVYSLRLVRLQFSGNGGKTWRTLTLVRHGSVWIARIADPAGGFVSLRSTVTDVHGDSTTETIFNAYAIS